MSTEEEPASVQETDKQAGEVRCIKYHADPSVWSEKMLALLERGDEGTKWFSLIDKVYRGKTLEIAWERVKSNAGACGSDGISIARFGKDSQKRLLAVSEHLKNQSYQPQAVKRVWIPKAGSKSEKRPLGIPTVRDRIVQTATKMVIEPIFEKEFAEHSYGFRPGRGCKDALRRVDHLLREGYHYVVDADIRSFFDEIDHEKLMTKVKERIADGRVLKMIEQMLKTGILEEGKYRSAEEGTPQGGVISPLLANIFLNELDWELARAGHEMTRYADDFVVQCRSEDEAKEVMKKISQWTKANGLRLHREKTRIVDFSLRGAYFDFLGYRFLRGPRSGKLIRVSRDKSLQKLKRRLKPLTKRASGHSLEAIIAKINPILKGWYAYFKHCKKWHLEQVDGWARGRLRSILRKRRGGRGRGRGKDHQRWRNHYFAELGLFSLGAAHADEYASLRDGAKC